MDNGELEDALEEIATLLQLTGANPFKTRAYQRGARTVGGLTEDLSTIHARGELATLKGIGASIAKILTELLEQGRSEVLEGLRADVPTGLLDILALPGLGPKKVHALWNQLEIATIAELSYACNENRLVELKGFGQKTQVKILAAIAHAASHRGRKLYPYARSLADELVSFLVTLPGARRVEVAGSLRRGRETIGDLDVLVDSSAPGPIMDAVASMPHVSEVIVKGDTKTSVRLEAGMAVDVRVVEADAFPYALLYFTGSKDHNVELRSRARERGYSLNEYALTPLEDAPPITGLRDESEVFAALGLPYIPPEMRESYGELELAARDGVPQLVTEADIRGVLHMHTRASDGSCSIDDLCEQARLLGYEYIGISDHSKAAFYAGGLDEARVAEQAKDIVSARERYPDLTIFHGIEADILPSGEVDLDDETLASLDFVIASVHSQLGMEREAMTARLVRALEHPSVSVLGHPTGRILLGRKGYSFDWGAVLDAAKANGVAIECNANPHRLDIDPVHIRRACERGVKICINPDAHAAEALADTRYGVLAARRGWARPSDVVNSLDAESFAREFLTKA